MANLRAYLMSGLVAAAAIFGLLSWHQHVAHAAIEQAVQARDQELHLEVVKEQAASDEKVRKAETAAVFANWENRNAEVQRNNLAERDRAAARSELDRLRQQIAANRGRGDEDGQGAQSGPGSDVYAATGRALGECSARYEEVAGLADTLTNQVIGLQDYITRVVLPIAGRPP